MSKDVIALDFDGNLIKLMIGNNKIVKYNDIIELSLNSNDSEDKTNNNEIVSILDSYLKRKGIKEKNVVISIHESDVVVRHLEVPIMDDKGIRGAITWEINQYLPQNGNNHCIDYEIIDRIEEKNKKVFKILVAALPKEKVDKYIDIIRRLRLNLINVNIAPNTIAKCFGNISKINKSIVRIGIIDIGFSSTSISILENGKLFIERDILFGISNFITEVSDNKSIERKAAEEYLFNTFSFINNNDSDDTEEKFRHNFDNALSSFSKVIQFYCTGKASKKLDQIYIIGSGCKINGLTDYAQDYFETPTDIIQSEKQINLSIKLLNKINLADYISTIGLLLRNNEAGLNLLPNSIKSSHNQNNNIIKYSAAGIVLAAILIIGAVTPRIYLLSMKSEESSLKAEIDRGKSVLSDNVKLNSQVNDITQYTNKVDAIKNEKISVVDRFDELKKYIPSDLTIQSASFNNNTFSLAVNTTNYNSINEFQANIETCNKYKSISVPGISFDKSSGKYSFTATITCSDNTTQKTNK